MRPIQVRAERRLEAGLHATIGSGGVAKASAWCLALVLGAGAVGLAAESGSATDPEAAADLILYNGKVATVNASFAIHEAIAVRDGRILDVGRNEDVLRRRRPGAEVVDLEGKLVIPGLIDSHTHPVDACVTEFDHPIPAMESVSNVLDFIRERARVLPDGDWIVVRQVFITRLEEQRYPTRAELDEAAPRHPALFATGPDASLNSLALRLSGIDRDFRVTDGGTGFAEKDPASGEPTGILRNATRFVKVKSSTRAPSHEDKARRLAELFNDYNAVGITTVCDRDASAEEIVVYKELRQSGRLSVRVRISQHVESVGEDVEASIRKVAEDPLFRQGDDWLRIIGVKTYLDGGMLTGSAYMRQPWGVSAIYGIKDPAYRGVLFIKKERLRTMARVAAESGLQFTAHSVGDGAVHALLDVYDELSRELPLRQTRPCVSHSNFMSREAVEQAARLGVFLDIQPAWLYLDTRTLVKHFGYERLRWFQPLRTCFEAGAVAGGGSDHMQKIGAARAINPYSPFLGMATAVTRMGKGHPRALHPEEALNREQALRFYTINNARMLFLDDRLGSLEPGKLADMVVVDTDLLTCRPEALTSTRVLRTYVGGKLVGPRPSPQAGGVKFIDTSFENASPLWYEPGPDGTILVRLLYDQERSSPNRAAGHFHFQVHAEPGSKVTLEFKNLDNIWNGRPGSVAGELKVAYVSADGREWKAVRTRSLPGERVQLDLEMPGERLFVARLEPYRLSDLDHFLAALRGRPQVEISQIGRTVEGRPLEIIRIGNPKAAHRLFLRARAHPWESGGNWVVQGLINRLLKDDGDAQRCLERYCVYVMPMANKDGVARGRTRFNSRGKDLNRDWDRPADAELAPENHALEKWLERLIGEGLGPHLALDLHNDGSGLLHISRPPVENLDRHVARMKTLEELLRRHTWFTEGGTKETVRNTGTLGEGWLTRYGVDAAIHEFNCHWIAGLNDHPSGRHWEHYGAQLARVFLGYFETAQ